MPEPEGKVKGGALRERLPKRGKPPAAKAAGGERYELGKRGYGKMTGGIGGHFDRAGEQTVPALLAKLRLPIAVQS